MTPPEAYGLRLNGGLLVRFKLEVTRNRHAAGLSPRYPKPDLQNRKLDIAAAVAGGKRIGIIPRVGRSPDGRGGRPQEAHHARRVRGIFSPRFYPGSGPCWLEAGIGRKGRRTFEQLRVGVEPGVGLRKSKRRGRAGHALKEV